MSKIIIKKKTLEFNSSDELYALEDVKKVSSCKNFLSFTFAKNLKTNVVNLIALFSS